MPLISVIIPCYNSAQYLAACLDSVLNQSLQDFEIICVDNGSTDDTKNIIKRYQLADKRISLIDEHRKGANFARNTGLKASKAEILQFLDSDDVIAPEKFEKQVPRILEGLDVVVSDRSVWDENLSNQKSFHSFSEIENAPLNTAISKIIITGNPLYRKSTLIENGMWDESLVSAQDWELNIRLSLNKVRIGYSAGNFLLCRSHPNSLSGDWRKVNSNMLIVLEKHFQLIIRNRQLLEFGSYHKIFHVYFQAMITEDNPVHLLKEYRSFKTPFPDWKFMTGINRLLLFVFGLNIYIRLKRSLA